MQHITFLLLAYVHSVAFLNDAAPKFDGILRNATDGTMDAYMIPPFKSSHASFIQPCPTGDLVMTWFSGSKEGVSGVSCMPADDR